MNPSRLPKIIYNQLKSGNELWYKELENLFISINALDVLISNVPVVDYKEIYTCAENLLMDHHCHQWSLTVENKPKLHYYPKNKNKVFSGKLL